MSKVTSPYYPPRARWYAPLFRMSGAVRRGMAMDRIRLAPSVKWSGLALSFLVPGLGFYLRGPRLFGRVAMGACLFLFLVFLAGFGFPFANFAFGLMVSIHTSGIVYYCGPELQTWEIKNRILFTILVLMAVGFLLYGPLRDFIQNRFLMPLRFNGQVVVVQKLAPAASVKRGDWIAYHTGSAGLEFGGFDDWVHIRRGLGLGPVLAVTGDTVEFSRSGYSVNGVLHPSLPFMPFSGSLVVAQKQWFIWPNYNVSGHNYADLATSLMLKMANVSEDQYAGKPFEHWFWRKQVLP